MYAKSEKNRKPKKNKKFSGSKKGKGSKQNVSRKIDRGFICKIRITLFKNQKFQVRYL